LDNFNRLAQPVTVIDQSVGQALQADQILDTGLYQPVNQYLADPSPTIEGLVAALNALPETGGTVVGHTVDNELRFEMVFDASRVSAHPIDLGSRAAALGISLPAAPSVTVNACLHFDFSFDVDLTSNEFSIRLNNNDPARFAASVRETNLNFGVHFASPAADLDVTSGMLHLDATATAAFKDPHGDGRITENDLLGTPLDTLLGLGASGSASGILPLNTSVPGFEILGPTTLAVHAGQVFSLAAPDVSLSLSLSPDLRTALGSALTSVNEVGHTGYVYWYDPVNNTPVPILNTSLNALFYPSGTAHIEDFLNLGPSATAYFQSTGTPTADGLGQALVAHGLALAGDSATGSLAEGPISIVGGLDPVRRQVRFDVSLDAHVSGTFPFTLDLGRDAHTVYGLKAAASTFGTGSADSDLNLRFSFGMDLDPYLADPSHGFQRPDIFLQFDSFVVSSTVQATGVNADLNVGFLQARIVNGSAQLNPSVIVTFANPDGSRKVTLQDLWSPNPDLEYIRRTHLTPISPFGANLIIDASLGGYDFATTSPRITASSTNLFTVPPVVQVQNFDHLIDFSYVDPHAVLGTLGQLGTWFAQFRTSAAFQTPIPFTQGKTIGDVFKLDELFSEQFLQKFTTTNDSGDVVPTFATAQDLADQLATQLGLDPQFVHAQYDPNRRELTYHVKFSRAFDQAALPLGFNVSDLPLIVINSSSTIAVNADATLEFTFGVSLIPSQVPRLASRAGFDLPANGRLQANSGDAHFSLMVGNNRPVPVVIPQAATQNDQNLVDLVTVINNALRTAGLGSSVVAALSTDSGNRITLSATSLGAGTVLEIHIGSPSDPSVTQLGFEDGQVARAQIPDLFIQDASVNANASLSVTDIQTSARFALLGIEVGHGSVSGEGTLALDLKDPNSGTVGGRIALGDLFKNLNNIPLLVRSSLIGSADLGFTNISADADFLGTLTGNPSVHIVVPDFNDLSTSRAMYVDFDKFLQFRTLTFANVLDALSHVVSTLHTYPSFGFLDQKLPLVDVSAADILDYAGRFASVVDNLQKNPAITLQVLDQRLREALNLPPNSDLVRISVDSSQGTALKIELTYRTPLVQESRNLNLDVSGLAGLATGGVPASLQGVSRLAQVNAWGQLQVAASARLQLELGIDLNAFTAPRPFLYGTTSVTLDTWVKGSNLNFSAAIGPLGLFIKNGSALLDRDGSGSQKATFGITFQNPGARYYFGDNILGSVVVQLTGQLHVSLPLYFPTENDPLGSPNQLVFVVNNLSDFLRGRVGSVAVSTPDISSVLHNLNALLDLLRDPAVFQNGLDTLLAFLQNSLNSQVLDINLPLIGTHLKDAAQFIQSFRTNLIGMVRDKVEHPGSNLINTLQTGLTDLFDSLHLLVGTVTLDGTNYYDTVQFNVHLHQNLAITQVPINFNLGLPALGLSVNSNIQVEVGWDFDLRFGVNTNYGFYFDTSMRNPLHVDLRVTTPGLQAIGRLAFLQLNVHDNPTSPTAFNGSFMIDIKSPDEINHPDRLTFSQIVAGIALNQVIEAHLSASAQVHLSFVASFGGNAEFPRFLADLNLGWNFAPSDPDLTGERPTELFSNVRLDMGSFFGQFVSPILTRVKNVLDPVRPVIDVLTARIPVISDLAGRTFTLVDLASAFGFSNFNAFIDGYNFLYRLATSVPTDGSNLIITFGDFNLGALVDIRTVNDLTHVAVPDLTFLTSVADQLTAENASGATKSFTLALNSPSYHFQFPILGNNGPKLAFELLLGQPVDVFTFDMTALDLHLSYNQEFPILGPIVATLRGNLDAAIRFAFGYDTVGLQEFAQSHNSLDLLDGFYVNAPSTYARISGGISGGVGVDLILVSGGVEGGIQATVTLRLHNPVSDPKVRYRYLRNALEHNPLNLFDVSGALTARLYAWFEINLFFYHHREEFNIAQVTLVDFSHTAAPAPVLATDRGDGVLQLNMGPHAAERLYGNVQDGDERFEVRHVSGTADEETVDVTYYGADGPITQRYTGVKEIVAWGGHGDDTINLRGVLADSELHGGLGNNILYASDGSSLLYGGPRSDDLYGGAGQTVFIGGPGHHRLFAGAGTAIVRETADTNFVLADNLLEMPGYGTDELFGVRQAELTGGPGDDTFTVSGWTGVATLNGGGGFSTVVSTNDADFALTDTGLIVSTGARFTLHDIEQAILTGGPGDDVFSVSNWTGIALLDGGDGNATFTVAFTGSGTGTTTITKSSPIGTAALTVYADPLSEVDVTDYQVRLWDESVTFDGIDSLSVSEPPNVAVGRPVSNGAPDSAATTQLLGDRSTLTNSSIPAPLQDHAGSTPQIADEFSASRWRLAFVPVMSAFSAQFEKPLLPMSGDSGGTVLFARGVDRFFLADAETCSPCFSLRRRLASTAAIGHKPGPMAERPAVLSVEGDLSETPALENWRRDTL
jgi:hypothetical protein